MPSKSYDAIVIGGGAAGLFCAAQAGRRGKRVVVLERNSQVGRKILISGGGRCNFTNLDVSAENFVSQNPHFAKSALARYTPHDFIDLVKKHRIQFYEKKLGQLFCCESSRQIVDMLLAECRAAQVKIETGCTVGSVDRAVGLFSVRSNKGEFTAPNLIIATGGLSFAKVGATDLGYRIAGQFGLDLVETRPSLVPLILRGENYRELAGISVAARVATAEADFRENILFTHRGMSGPAILQISNYWEPEAGVVINLVPEVDLKAYLNDRAHSSKRVENVLADLLPARVAERVIGPWAGRPINSLNEDEIAAAAGRINQWTVRFGDTEGYDKAEVTLGGVSTDELSSKTFEAKEVSGLFFIGEVIDVTGWLGGYNFQWAWSSGHAAAHAI